MVCRVVLVAMAAVLALAGCTASGDPDVEVIDSSTAASSTAPASSSSTTATPSTTVAPTTTVPDVPMIEWDYMSPTDLPVVTLLDPGGEPLSVRVYEAAVGASQTMRMRLETAVEQSIDGQEGSNVETVATMEFTSSVLAVGEEGITLEETYGSGSVEGSDPVSVMVTEAAYEQLEGVTTYTLMSPRGEVLAVSTSGLPPEVAEMTRGMMNAAVPLPVDPIGVGAEWETVSTVESGGLTFVQTTLVRLTGIDGPLLTLETSTTQTLGPDSFAALGIDEGDVTFVSTGSGVAVWNLEGPFPIEASSMADQSLSAVLSIGEDEATLDQAISLTIDLRPWDSTASVSTIAEGKLTVCSQVPYLSFGFEDPASPSGYSGFDIEVIDAVARELGLELVIVPTPFDGIWLQPGAGACDVVASAMTITEERANQALFSDPYFNNALTLIVTRDNDGLAIADTGGLGIGVQTATAGEEYADQHMPSDANLVSFASTPGLFEALEAGTVDAAVVDLGVAGDRILRTPGLSITETYETDEMYGFGVALGNEILSRRIDAALASLNEDGTLDFLHQKYFGIPQPGSPTGADPALGERTYVSTCAACHGTSAEGVDGLGLPLTESGFLASMGADDFVAFMHVGRPATHPDNTTGVDCPPLGGNPSLTDAHLTALHAYLESLGTP